MHDISLVVTLAAALAVALVLGWITQRLGLSTLVGYLLAGIVVGPHTPGFVADGALASRLAEIGVILLMFSVGMHFHVQDLLRVWRVAVPGAVAQSVVAGVCGWLLARAVGWSDVAGAVFGMSLAVASTAVLTRMLIDNGKLASHGGHVAVGWLIVEDVFTVVALVALPALAAAQSAPEGGSLGKELALALGKGLAFGLLLWALGNPIVKRIIEPAARMRSEELLTLAVFVVALGIAVIAAGVFHVSVALGAFFAGMVVGRSRIGPQAAGYMTPFRDVFAALFFVSVGMLFDPLFPVRHPLLVLAGLAIVLVAKPIAAWVIVRLLRDTPRTAATVSVGLAQIGEFSFLLGTLGVTLGVLPQAALDTLVATAILSIAANPLLFRALARWEAGLAGRSSGGEPAVGASDELEGHVVLCGEGPLQRALLARLRTAEAAVVVIDADLDFVTAQNGDGRAAVYGDASRPDVLRAAGLERAGVLVIAGPALATKMAIAVAARRLRADLPIVATALDAGEQAWLEEFGVTAVANILAPAVDAIAATVRETLDAGGR
ncbi:MAG TPA: cation:proton antiporter [Casimicrobiaceae bacterium]|nr:cation:proton antiporter [Casimicrobiaceae bacterium]